MQEGGWFELARERKNLTRHFYCLYFSAQNIALIAKYSYSVCDFD
jgi:hypothetical protein